MPEIVVDNVTVSYTNKDKTIIDALDRASCTFKNNTFNCVIGYSGSGKTTLLRSIAGLTDYDGKITLDGVDAEDIPLKKRNLSYVSQEYALYPSMTIFDNIAFPLKMMGAPQKEIVERVNAMGKKLDLLPCFTRKPRHISGGQQQRVAIARELIKSPTICLFDEPFSNLDESLRLEARQYLKKMMIGTMCTTIFVTHNMEEAMSLADELYVVDNGKVILSGKPLEVYNSGNEVVEALKENQWEEI